MTSKTPAIFVIPFKKPQIVSIFYIDGGTTHTGEKF